MTENAVFPAEGTWNWSRREWNRPQSAVVSHYYHRVLALIPFADLGTSAIFTPENTRSSTGNPWAASKLVWSAELALCCTAARLGWAHLGSLSPQCRAAAKGAARRLCQGAALTSALLHQMCKRQSRELPHCSFPLLLSPKTTVLPILCGALCHCAPHSLWSHSQNNIPSKNSVNRAEKQ